MSTAINTTVRVRVTQDHIARGSRYCSLRCPIALALRDVGLSAAVVDSESVEIDGLGNVRLPPEANDFIGDFDWGTFVAPFEFDLDLSAEATNGD